MKARLWFVHKGIERLFQGRTPSRRASSSPSGSRATPPSATPSPTASPSRTLPATDVPRDAQRLRAILLELERLYNHVADIGALCNDVGFGVVHAHALRIREQLLRLNAEVTGHRLLRGGDPPRRRPRPRASRPPPRSTPSPTTSTRSSTSPSPTAPSSTDSPAPRCSPPSRPPRSAPSATSPAPRDSPRRPPRPPLRRPVRRPRDPRPAHRRRPRPLPRARRRVRRVRRAPAALLTDIDPASDRQRHDSPSTDRPVQRRRASSKAGGAPSSTASKLDADGTLTRVKIVDPSFFNWPALPVALADTIVPDFPLTNKSFNLSYAGNDL